MEGAATTVYAQGGRGNARLVAWEGERTVTFTMEDALISPAGFSILTGAGLIQSEERPVIMHTTEQTAKIKLYAADNAVYTGAANQTIERVDIALSQNPYLGKNRQSITTGSGDDQTITYSADPFEDFIYVMLLDDHGEVCSEPYIASEVAVDDSGIGPNGAKTYVVSIYAADEAKSDNTNRYNDLSVFTKNSVVLVDYYVEKTENAFQVDITPDKFGGNFYLEASTLFRTTDGVDMPAEFIIPNCKVQSNFTFTMASSGDPSTFTFTMDAFPDYTRWDKTKKVYAAIQVLDLGDAAFNFERLGTAHDHGDAKNAYKNNQKPYLEENY